MRRGESRGLIELEKKIEKLMRKKKEDDMNREDGGRVELMEEMMREMERKMERKEREERKRNHHW